MRAISSSTAARHQSDPRRRHGVPAFRPVSVEDGLRQRRLWAAHGAASPRPRSRAACRAFIKHGRACGLRAGLSLPDVRRHAAALRAGARARGRAERAADGRAVRVGRRADARDPAVRAAAHLGEPPDHHGVRHPFDRGSRADGRPCLRARRAGRAASARPSRSICRVRARARPCASRASPRCANRSGAR